MGKRCGGWQAEVDGEVDKWETEVEGGTLLLQ